MPEAVRAVVNWGFGGRCLAKIYSWADACNTRSWRVMEKVGMTREGVCVTFVLEKRYPLYKTKTRRIGREYGGYLETRYNNKSAGGKGEGVRREGN